MVLELVKEYSQTGTITYHVTADDKFVSGTVETDLTTAQQKFNDVKESYSKARKEILIREEI